MSRQTLLAQLDSLVPEDIADSWDSYYSDSTHSTRHSLSSAISLETVPTSTPNTPVRKPIPRHNHQQFQAQIRSDNANIDKVSNMLDCIKDMIEAETEEIEQQLNQFAESVTTSVPSNTYVVPVFLRRGHR